MMKFDAHQPICYLSPGLKGQILSCYFLTVGIGAVPNADMARTSSRHACGTGFSTCFIFIVFAFSSTYDF
jgi:hypothetical protein